MTTTAQILYLCTFALGLILNLYIVYLCDKQGGRVVARYIAFITIFSNMLLISWLGISLAPSEEVAFFWMRLRLVTTALLAVWSLAWVLYYLDMHQWLAFPRSLLLWVFPIALLYFVLFDSRNPFFIRDWSWTRYEIIGIEAIYQGPMIHLSSLHFVAVALLAAWSVIYRFQRVNHLINRQTAWLFGGILLAWVIGSLAAWGLIPPGLPSMYPIACIIAALMVIYSLRITPLVDLAPTAYELVFRNISEHVIVLNDVGLIVDFNPSAETLFSPEQKPLGQAISAFPELALAFEHQESSHEIFIQECFYKTSVSPVYLREGHSYGHILMLTDITERKKAELERERLLATLNAYAHTVAHDLKNPVGVINGYIELSMDEAKLLADNAYLINYLQKAAINTKSMENIINSMLMLATLRQNEMRSLEVCDMQTHVKLVLERLVFEIERSGAIIHIEAHLPDAFGYGNWIEEIWLNYLSNAIKYGGHPPQIHISASHPADNPGFVHYHVRDNGMGMNAEEQAGLFQQHSRLRRHAEIEGNGLGLMIVRQMVERMGGLTYVESKPGQGSCFSFSLPAALRTHQTD